VTPSISFSGTTTDRKGKVDDDDNGKCRCDCDRIPKGITADEIRLFIKKGGDVAFLRMKMEVMKEIEVRKM
jgi:hypothetical protein